MISDDYSLNVFKILFTIKGISTLVFSILPLLLIFSGAYLFQQNEIAIEAAQLGRTIVMLIVSLLFLFFFCNSSPNPFNREKS